MNKTIKTVSIIALLLPLLCIVGICAYSAAYTARIEKAFPAKGEVISVRGSDVHIIRSSDNGSPILMIHGAGGNAREFELTLTPHLKDKHQVILIDRPGHGYSEALKNSHQLGVQAAQIGETLNSLLPDEKVLIVGHSFGATVALRLALDQPKIVNGVVLIAPVSHDWGPGKVEWFNAFASKEFTGLGFSQLIPIFGPDQARNGLWQTFHPAPEPQGYYDDAGIGLMFRPANFRANARELNSFREELIAQQDRYNELKMPIVVISGSADTSINPDVQNTQLKQKVLDLEIIEFPNEGHVPHFRRAKDVAEIIALQASSINND